MQPDETNRAKNPKRQHDGQGAIVIVANQFRALVGRADLRQFLWR